LSGAASAHVPTEADLETYVPSLPTGWATGGVEGVKKAAAAAPAKTVKTEQTASKKRKHKLPKGASDSKPFSGDVSDVMRTREADG
jgi:signal recognition particle subunit SRP72